MDNRTEVVLSDLGRLCTPQEHIAPVREIGTVSYPHLTLPTKGLLRLLPLARP